MREIVGRMRLEEMVSDRQKFADLVKENAEPDLAAMGLDVVSFNVQNFTDSNGVIDDLGIDNISQIKKKAAIAKAEAEKEIAVAKGGSGSSVQRRADQFRKRDRHSRTTSWICRRQSFRRNSRTASGRKQMRHMRSRKRNSERRLK